MPYPTYQARDSDHIRKLKQQAEVLRTQASIRRPKLSETLKDLINYCNQNMATDHLINPEKENPFKPKKPCAIL